MTRRRITLACGAYDRTAALRAGDVSVRGVDLNYLPLSIEETFYRMMRFKEFDAAELSLSTYVLTLPDGPFVALPVFPSRAFRHSAIYVRQDSEVWDPKDLAGGVIGVPEYQITAAVWIRGILADRHGLGVTSVRYRTGGLDEPGRVEKAALNLPEDVEVSPIPSSSTLSQMLLAGELDAVYSARNPGPFNQPGHGGLRRLFPDAGAVERQYASETGIFPIMHTIVLRRDVYEADRWLARELFEAFNQSKTVAARELAETAALSSMLPWAPEHEALTREYLGDDWWPYGLPHNDTTLKTFLRYSHQQGLAARLYDPAELFAPETFERFVV